MNIKIDKRIFYLIPILMVLVLGLVLSLNYTWPLSWDVYMHINYALTYMTHGITTVDPLLNAPAGKSIGYVPLFHIIMIIVSKCMGVDLLGAAKILQIIIPVAFTVLMMYITNKFYDGIAAIVSGLILVSSFIFTRVFLPIPESVAIVLFLAGVYLYYMATMDKKSSYALVSAVVALLIFTVHFSSFVYFVVLITALMMIQVVLQRNLSALKYYVYATVLIGVVGILSLGFLYIVSPDHMSSILDGLFSIFNDPMSIFMGQKAMGLERYIKCLGAVPLICGIVGLYYSFRYHELRFVALWALVTFVLSNLHWFGIPVYTYRMLIYVLMPAVILGGYAISKLCHKLKNVNKSLPIILMGALIIMSFSLGVIHIHDDSVINSYATDEISTYKIAQPTASEEEVIEFFNTTPKDKSIITNNMFFGTIISSVDGMPLHYKFNEFATNNVSLKTLNKEKIRYIIYDKSLVLPNSTSTQEVICVNGSFYPTYYMTQNITSDNFNQIRTPYTTHVFENDKFIILEVED